MRPVTLKDVAAAAGVSVSTVSRVLDERLPTSKSPTAERVRAVAAELGYRRHAAAAALRRGDTGTVGVLVPRLSDTVMALLFEAIYAEAAARGMFAMVSVCGDDRAEEGKAVEALLARGVDGLILAATRLDDDLPSHLRARATPHVLALRTDGVSSSSVCDDELGGYLATRHLLDLGHSRLAVLPGPDFTSTARARLSGFERAVREAGIEVPASCVRHSGFGFDAGVEVTTSLLHDRPEITAIFAANDTLAMGVSAAAVDLGLTVPEDLSVVGYNDTPLAGQLTVPLTTVHVPFDVVATAALDLLLAQVQGTAPSPSTRTAIPTLIPRRSTRRRGG